MTVRRVMNAIICEQLEPLTDKLLSTFLCEVESILNSRPLTRLSDDPNDVRPLTPNYLLLVSPTPELPPGMFTNYKSYHRCRWRYVQHLTNTFWQHWRKDYLRGLRECQLWSRDTDRLCVSCRCLVT